MEALIIFEKYGEVAELVDGARLESVYTPKAYHGFESHPLRTLNFMH